MNTILTKCIEELKTDKPRIDYVLGMLETLIAMQGATPIADVAPRKAQEVITDVGTLLDAQTAALIKNMPPVVME